MQNIRRGLPAVAEGGRCGCGLCGVGWAEKIGLQHDDTSKIAVRRVEVPIRRVLGAAEAFLPACGQA